MITSICLLPLTLLAPILAVNPGVKSRITNAGINYARDVALDILAQRIGSVHIPDQSGSTGPVKYYISAMKLQNFKKPNSDISIVPSASGLLWKGNSGTIAVHGNWRYVFHEIVTISDSGTFDASSTSFSFTAEVGLGVDPQGRPRLTAKSCSCDMGSVSISFHGGQSWIYNMFSGIVANLVKGQLQGQLTPIFLLGLAMAKAENGNNVCFIGNYYKNVVLNSLQLCNLVTQAINGDANSALAKIPVTVDIDSVFILDYRFVDNPTFQTAFVDTYHKGEVYWKKAIAEAPFSPPALIEISDTNKMLYVWISGYTFNTIAYEAQQNDFLKYNLTQNDLPDSSKSLLNTTCHEGVCIGQLIPKIGSLYPDSTVQLNLASTIEPNMTVNGSGITLTCGGQVIMYAIQPPNLTMAYLMTLNANMSAGVNVSVSNGKVFGNIGKTNISLHVVRSVVGDIKDAALQFIIDFVLKAFVVPMLNNIGSKGFPLPVMDDINFINSSLQLVQDAIIISTDVHYSG